SVTQKFDYFIRSVAEDQVLRFEAKFRCDCLTQIESAAVGIKMRIFERGVHRLKCFGRRPKWIFVRGQLDDFSWMDAHLARSFLDWFSGLINGESPQLRIREIPDRRHARRVNGTRRLSNVGLSLLLLVSEVHQKEQAHEQEQEQQGKRTLIRARSNH